MRFAPPDLVHRRLLLRRQGARVGEGEANIVLASRVGLIGRSLDLVRAEGGHVAGFGFRWGNQPVIAPRFEFLAKGQRILAVINLAQVGVGHHVGLFNRQIDLHHLVAVFLSGVGAVIREEKPQGGGRVRGAGPGFGGIEDVKIRHRAVVHLERLPGLALDLGRAKPGLEGRSVQAGGG